MNDERVCFYLFLLGVLLLNDIFLGFRQSRHGFIGKQDGASGHIVHPPPPCIWLANGFPWQLILN